MFMNKHCGIADNAQPRHTRSGNSVTKTQSASASKTRSFSTGDDQHIIILGWCNHAFCCLLPSSLNNCAHMHTCIILRIYKFTHTIVTSVRKNILTSCSYCYKHTQRVLSPSGLFGVYKRSYLSMQTLFTCRD